MLGTAPDAVAQFVFWNGGQQAHPAKVTAYSSAGVPLSMRWQHGVVGESASLPVPAGRATLLSETSAASCGTKIGWAQIWTPAPFFRVTRQSNLGQNTRIAPWSSSSFPIRNLP